MRKWHKRIGLALGAVTVLLLASGIWLPAGRPSPLTLLGGTDACNLAARENGSPRTVALPHTALAAAHTKDHR